MSWLKSKICARFEGGWKVKMEELFTTNWSNGNECVSDRIVSYCKANGIKCRRNHYFEMEVNINGKWIATDYRYDKANDILIITSKH